MYQISMRSLAQQKQEAGKESKKWEYINFNLLQIDNKMRGKSRHSRPTTNTRESRPGEELTNRLNLLRDTPPRWLQNICHSRKLEFDINSLRLDIFNKVSSANCLWWRRRCFAVLHIFSNIDNFRKLYCYNSQYLLGFDGCYWKL